MDLIYLPKIGKVDNTDCKKSNYTRQNMKLYAFSFSVGSIPWPVCMECPLDLIMISCSSPSDIFLHLGGLVLRKAFKPRGHSSDTRPPYGTRLICKY